MPLIKYLSRISKIKAICFFTLAVIGLQTILSTFYLSKKSVKVTCVPNNNVVTHPKLHLSSTNVTLEDYHKTTSYQTAEAKQNVYKNLCFLQGYSRDTPVNHTSAKFIIEEPSFCTKDIYILYFIQTAVRNKGKRDKIRQTWGKYQSWMIGLQPYKVLFVMGTTKSIPDMEKIESESDEFEDIIQADFFDSYRNLTYKHLYALKWIHLHCQQAAYIFKADDDVFINVFKVQEAVETILKGKRNFIYCDFALARAPYRDKRKFMYAVSESDWPDFRYPSHCQGLGYLMSSDVISRLYHCSFWRHYIWIDDLFVTGALRDALSIQIIKTYYNFEITAWIPKTVIDKLKQSNYLDYQADILRYINTCLVMLDYTNPKDKVAVLQKFWSILSTSKKSLMLSSTLNSTDDDNSSISVDVTEKLSPELHNDVQSLTSTFSCVLLYSLLSVLCVHLL